MRRPRRLVYGLALVAGSLLSLSCGAGSANSGGSGGGGDTTPSIILINPAGATAGGPGFTLTVSGVGFISTSAVNWNGAPRATTLHSATVLSAAIAGADIAISGSATVTVVNPTSFGEAISNIVNFPINPVVIPPPTGAGVVALVSAADDGTPGNRQSDIGTISSTGRFVAFASLASNFSSMSNNSFYNIFLRDTCSAAPTVCAPSIIDVSVAPDGSLGNGDSGSSIGFAKYPALSGDGRYVGFVSNATNLVAGDTNGSTDVFLRDTCVGAVGGCSPSTTLISVATDGTQGNGGSSDPSISGDGRFVVFDSNATNLVANDTNAAADVFLRDTCIHAPSSCTPSTVRLSVASDGTQGNDASDSPAISASGRFVAFQSYAKNLVADDTSLFIEIFVRDTCFNATGSCTPSTTLVSVGPGGALGNAGSTFPAINADGRFIAFASFASNLVPGGTLPFLNSVFVRDTCAGMLAGCSPATSLVSVSSSGIQGNDASGLPAISSTGRFIAFNSDAKNLVIGDTNGFTDVFVHDTCAGADVPCFPSTVIVSIKLDGTQGNFNSAIPTISADGHFVSFIGGSSNLVPIVAASNVFLARTSF